MLIFYRLVPKQEKKQRHARFAYRVIVFCNYRWIGIVESAKNETSLGKLFIREAQIENDDALYCLVPETSKNSGVKDACRATLVLVRVAGKNVSSRVGGHVDYILAADNIPVGRW